MTAEVIRGDRRVNRRYELELQICFSYVDENGPNVGCGVTVELSRTGVRFQAIEAPPVGCSVEARVAWPFLLQGICPLEVVLTGVVVRSDADGTALRVRSYEFRTCGERSFSQAPVQHRTLRIA
jgi:hypothetical protein